MSNLHITYMPNFNNELCNKNIKIAFDNNIIRKYYKATHDECYLTENFIIENENKIKNIKEQKIPNAEKRLIGCLCDCEKENNIEIIIKSFGRVKFLIENKCEINKEGVFYREEIVEPN